MNYQAMFGQMSSSIGVASETSLKLSNALTMIGADLASVKNMDFDKVWNDMASGLAGMSRTLDKYGVNIRNVNLQQKLTELGINANISALNQNDKALLRGIILLDSTRYAWADLAETLNQPANQLRLVKSNLENLSRTIGNLFLPVVAKVLPYINGFIISLQRLFAWIGKIFKIDISNLLPKGGGGSSGISDLIDDTEELKDNLNKATSAAKKLNKQLRSFDELSVISIPDGGAGSGTGGGGIGSGLLDSAFDEAYQEYLDAWDDAFEKVEDQANQIANKIQGFFKELFKPIDAAWGNESDFVIQGWNHALEETRELINDIGRDFSTVWQQQETTETLEDIFHIIGDIGLAAGNLTENLKTAWNTNEVGLHIFENIRDIIGAVIENLRTAADYTVTWSNTLDFYPLLEKIEEWTKSLVPVFDKLSGIVTDFYTKVLLPLGKWTLEEGLPELLQVFIDFNNKVDWESLRTRLSDFWEHLEPFAETVGEGLILFVERVSDALADFANSETFDNFLTSVENWMDNIDAEDVADGIEKLAEAFITFKLSLLGFAAVKTVLPIIQSITVIAEKLSKFGGFAFSAGATAQLFDVIEHTKEFGETTGALDEAGSKIAELNEQFDNGSITLDEYNRHIEETKTELDEIAANRFRIPGVEYDENGWNKNLVELKDKLKNWWETDIKGIFSSWGQDISNFWNENVAPWFTKEKWQEVGQGIKDGISDKFNELKEWWSETFIVEWWENISPWFTKEKWQEVGQGIEDGLTDKWNEFADWWENTGIYNWWNDNVSPWFTLEKWETLGEEMKKGLSEKWNEFTDWWENTGFYNWWTTNVTPWFEKDKWSFDGIKEGLSSAWNAAIESIKQIWNRFANWLNEKLTWTIDPIEIMGKTVFDGVTIDLGKIPTFAKGGVVYSATPAIVGEMGAEAILPLTNEHSMKMIADSIISNMDYSTGMNDGYGLSEQQIYNIVYNAVGSAITNNQLLRQQNEILGDIREKPTIDNGTVAKSAIKGINEITRRMGKTPLLLY